MKELPQHLRLVERCRPRAARLHADVLADRQASLSPCREEQLGVLELEEPRRIRGNLDAVKRAAGGGEGDGVVLFGDARKTLQNWQGQADCWFLDGFSPAKNPELWGADLLKSVYDHTANGGTAATYTAAGFVRHNLELAGFTVKRSKGFGRKRHMTQAVKGAFDAKQ